MLEEKKTWKFTWTFTLVLVLLMALPLLLVVTMPSTDSFSRQNEYPLGGYRAAGYYVERVNPTVTGYINVTHPGGTNIMYIEMYNIKNVTLDMDTLYENRNTLFGWVNITWVDAVRSVSELVLYVNTTHEVESFSFVDYEEVWMQVDVDGTIRDKWMLVSSNVYTGNGLSVGNHIVTISINRAPVSWFDAMIWLVQISIMLSVFYLIFKIFKQSINNTNKRGK